MRYFRSDRTNRLGVALAGTAIGLTMVTFGAVAPAASAAAGTWSVSPGGAFSSSSFAKIKNITRGWTITCRSLQINGRAPTGSNLPSFPIVSIESSTFAECKGPSGLTFNVTSGNLFWDMNAESFDPALGKTTGTLFNIELNLAASNNCSADVGAQNGDPGTADATHINAGSHLAIHGGELAINFANFACSPSLIATGDKIKLVTVFRLDPAQTITSP